MEPMAGAALPGPVPCLHLNPPSTPSAFFASRPRLLVGIVTTFGFLGIAAATANAWLLMQWDKPFQRLIESNRTDEWDMVFRLASRLGSTIVVLTLGPVLAILSWRRCRAVSIALVVATFARPALEFTLKEIVGRDRPNLHQLVDGSGPSFPSGHPLAAVALWGLLPVVVGLFTRRALWWSSIAVSGTMILVISASRVYLGVHWLSDVIAGLLVGALFLLGVEWVMHRAHTMPRCCSKAPDTTRRPLPLPTRVRRSA
jgi:membrane-associated phospholipid phosphatase